MIPELTVHVWQTTLCAIAVGLLTLGFRQNRAKVRYWLWISASFKFLFPFALLMDVGTHAGSGTIAKRIASPSVASAIDNIQLPFSELMVMPDIPPAVAWVSRLALAVWACGFLTIALMRFRSWTRIRSAVRSAVPWEIPSVSISAKFASVRVCPALMEPGVVGLFRPVLLLPVGIVERLTKAQLETVLAHELSHVRRRDNLYASVHMIVEALFWFHPLVWWIGARLVEERERACDEEVLRLGNEPCIYAEAILKVCRLYMESPLVCVSGVTGSNLAKRIEAIMINRTAFNLNLPRKLLLALITLAALVGPMMIGLVKLPKVQAQTSVTTPEFEVASIKPDTIRRPQRIVVRNGRLDMESVSLRPMIAYAFSLPIDLVQGGPDWISNAERYTISAKATNSEATSLQIRQMLQKLLIERFSLTFHRETKQLPVYVLRLARNGPKLKEAKEDEEVRVTPGAPTQGKGQQALLAFSFQKESMNAFASFLNIPLRAFSEGGHEVRDETGLTGQYDFTLEFATTNPGQVPLAGSANQPDISGPDLFEALGEQLGLKLEVKKGPVEIIVIDHAERASAN